MTCGWRVLVLTVAVILPWAGQASAQWVDLTTPPASTGPGVQEILPRLTSLTHHGDSHYGVAFWPDGKLVVVCGERGEVPTVPQPGGQTANQRPRGSAAAAAIAAADNNLSGSPTSEGTLPRGGRYRGRLVTEATCFAVFDSETGELRGQAPEGVGDELSKFLNPLVPPHGKCVLGITPDIHGQNIVASWAVGGRKCGRVPLPDGFKPVYFDRSRTKDLLLARDWGACDYGDEKRTICLMDTRVGEVKPLSKIDVPNNQREFNPLNAGGVAFSPDGKHFAVGFSLWDLDSGQKVRQLPEIQEGKGFFLKYCQQIKFTPDGTYLVGYRNVSRLLVWNVESGDAEFALDAAELHPEGRDGDHTFWSIDFSPDGKWMVGTDGNLVRLWHFPSRKLVANLVGCVNTVWSVAFSPDGKTVAAGGSDCTTRLWNVSATIASVPGADSATPAADAPSSAAQGPDAGSTRN